MTTPHPLTHPEVQRLARLLLAARQERGVRILGWYETSYANRQALLMDARFLVDRGVTFGTPEAAQAA